MADDARWKAEIPIVEWEGHRMGAVRQVTLAMALDGEKVWLPATNLEQVVQCILWYTRRGIDPAAAHAIVHAALGETDAHPPR